MGAGEQTASEIVTKGVTRQSNGAAKKRAASDFYVDAVEKTISKNEIIMNKKQPLRMRCIQRSHTWDGQAIQKIWIAQPLKGFSTASLGFIPFRIIRPPANEER